MTYNQETAGRWLDQGLADAENDLVGQQFLLGQNGGWRDVSPTRMPKLAAEAAGRKLTRHPFAQMTSCNGQPAVHMRAT